MNWDEIKKSIPKNKFKGVKKNKQFGGFIAILSFKGKQYYLGDFKDEEIAAKNYDFYALKYIGKKTCFLNFPDYDYTNFVPKREVEIEIKEEDEYELDNILSNQDSKKRKNSGGKGRRGERLLVRILNERFPGKNFSRSVGSGNRWSQTKLTETAKLIFTGDIVTPDDFLFVLECKYGYNRIKLEKALKAKNGNKALNAFLEQSDKDSKRVNKKPLLCWKRNNKDWIAFLKTEHLNENLNKLKSDKYQQWSIFLLNDLLKEPESFFFKNG